MNVRYHTETFTSDSTNVGFEVDKWSRVIHVFEHHIVAVKELSDGTIKWRSTITVLIESNYNDPL